MSQGNRISDQKIPLPFKIKKPILATGSQTKNTLCFAQGGFAYLSSVHRDLDNPLDFKNFEKDLKYFLKKNPKIIACDLHPDYQSTKFAQELSSIQHPCLSLPVRQAGGRQAAFSIQHHHAHIASCMVENGLKNKRVIGVAFDGTGLGSDNALWGGEFLICDYKNFQRLAHLKEIPLIGGQRAILEPWRMSAAWLDLLYPDKFLNLKIDFTKGIDRNKWQVLKKIYLSGFNSPLASSMGRLFDAVASLVLAKYKVHFEAELAIELEKKALSYKLKAASYPFKTIKKKTEYVIDPAPLFKEMLADLIAQEPKEKIAYRFHLTVAEMICKACTLLGKKSKIKQVVLSGGVFQNKLLLNLSLGLLYQQGFQALTHHQLSCNDNNISLGQVAIANFKG